jgi:hypothetical protein
MAEPEEPFTGRERAHLAAFRAEVVMSRADELVAEYLARGEEPPAELLAQMREAREAYDKELPFLEEG